MTPGHPLHCVRCGAHIADGMRFCGQCGAPAVAATPPAPAPAQPQQAGWVIPTPSGPPTGYTPGVVSGGPVTPQLAGPATAPRELASNPQRTVGCVWLVIALLGGAGAVVPFVADIDMMQGGGALVMLGILVALTAVVVAVVYFSRGSTLTRVLTTDRLVYWQYAPDEWARYAEAEHGRQSSDMRGLFIIVAVISLVVGAGFLIADPEAGKFVFLVLLGVVVLCGLAAVISTASARSRNRSRVGDAYIAKSGVYLNGVLHTWTGLASLDGVSFAEADPPFIAFDYSMPSRTGRQSATVRVPVPRGQEAVARGLVAQFQSGAPRS